MQPRPMADTSRVLFPSLRVCIRSSVEGPRGDSPLAVVKLLGPSPALRDLLEANRPETERTVPLKGLPNPLWFQENYRRQAGFRNMILWVPNQDRRAGW